MNVATECAGAQVLAPGVTRFELRTPTLPPATATNTLIVAGDRVVVIEPGTPHSAEREQLCGSIDQWVAEGRQLVAVLLTHHHVDHTGSAEFLARRYNVPVLCHPLTRARLRIEARGDIDEGWRLELGRDRCIEAMFTPGHAPGHVVFRERSTGVSHVGDLVAGVGSILVDPDDGGSMLDYLSSLRRMLDFVEAHPGERWVPAHGPVLADPGHLIRGYIEHRLGRERKVIAALSTVPASLQAIIERAYADTPRSLWPLAEKAARAHLEKLIHDGVCQFQGGYVRLEGNEA